MWCHNPEDLDLNLHRRENFKPRIYRTIVSKICQTFSELWTLKILPHLKTKEFSDISIEVDKEF